MILTLLIALLHLLASMLPDPSQEPFIDVETAGKACGIGRSKAYAEARRYLATGEGLPCIAFGRTLRVPTAAILRLAQLEVNAQPGDAETSPGLVAVPGA